MSTDKALMSILGYKQKPSHLLKAGDEILLGEGNTLVVGSDELVYMTTHSRIIVSGIRYENGVEVGGVARSFPQQSDLWVR